jgi:hypothetical protein
MIAGKEEGGMGSKWGCFGGRQVEWKVRRAGAGGAGRHAAGVRVAGKEVCRQSKAGRARQGAAVGRGQWEGVGQVANLT